MGTTRRKLDPPAAFIDGRPHWYCTGPGHDEPRLLPKSEFYHYNRVTTDGQEYQWRMPVCKHCKYVRWRSNSHMGFSQSGKVSLKRMEPYLYELEARCGSASAAARRIGVWPHLFLSWQRRAKVSGTYRKAMYRETAMRVLNVLREVRAEQRGAVTNYAPKYSKAPMSVRRCSGCGGPQDSQTAGCTTCADRASKKNQRKKAREKLTA